MFSNIKLQLAKKGEAYLRIKVRPNSAINLVKEILTDGTIKIDISALAEKGKANKTLLLFLAKELSVPVGNVKIISGAGERLKLVKVCQNLP